MGPLPEISQLGRDLLAIRERAIAEGLKLMTAEELDREMDESRRRYLDDL